MAPPVATNPQPNSLCLLWSQMYQLRPDTAQPVEDPILQTFVGDRLTADRKDPVLLWSGQDSDASATRRFPT